MALPTQLIAGPDEQSTRSPVRRASSLTATVAGYLLRFGPHRSYGAARFDNAATMALCVFWSMLASTWPTTRILSTAAASMKSVALGVLHGSRPVVVGVLHGSTGASALMTLGGTETTTIVASAAADCCAGSRARQVLGSLPTLCGLCPARCETRRNAGLCVVSSPPPRCLDEWRDTRTCTRRGLAFLRH